MGVSFVAEFVDLGDEGLDLGLGRGQLVGGLVRGVAEGFFSLLGEAALLHNRDNAS